ncbi:MAG: FKBP-type peptidyl-prolyl cis-trans isomerase [Isosphaeraceae bacterium]
MKFSIIAATGLGLVAVSALAVGQDTKKAAPKAATPAPAPPAGLADLKSQASYGLGLSLGRNLKAQAVEIDPEVLARGLRDGLTGAKALMTDEQIQAAMTEFQNQLNARRMAEMKAAATKNDAAGKAFLAANKSKPGVRTLPSGLQYKVLKEGTGAIPKATDTVSTHYKGTLLDGTVFDSSIERGEPLSFEVNGVIAGWTEALQKMKVGSKWQLFVPANLAYGENPPQGSPIEPNSVLVFEVELLGIDAGKK